MSGSDARPHAREIGPGDGLGAFVTHTDVRVEGASRGPLSGLTFAAKDNMDVAGFRTGCGNPDWLATHPPASRTASCIQRLLDAGAALVGKTQMDELAFSLNGENVHYGTPVNPAAPGRIPGGSSSGSAVAVAGGLVDFALGTDTAGSVRVPASYCGVWAFRPTHGAIPLDGVVPLAPSFDVVGWFARDPGVLRLVGEVLLGDEGQGELSQVTILEPIWGWTDQDTCDALLDPCRSWAETMERPSRQLDPSFPLDGALDLVREVARREIRDAHGGWIAGVEPRFGEDIASRFRWAVDAQGASGPHRTDLARVTDRLRAQWTPGSMLAQPTTPFPALACGLPPADLDRARRRLLRATVLAVALGCPQVHVPCAAVGGRPVGLSILAPPEQDRRLLEASRSVGAS